MIRACLATKHLYPLFFSFPGRADPGDPVDKTDAEPLGRLHRLLLPRIRLRSLPLPAEQPAGRKGRHQEEGHVAVQVKQPGR